MAGGGEGRPDPGCLTDLRRGTPNGDQGGPGAELSQNGGKSAGSRVRGEGMERKEKQLEIWGKVAEREHSEVQRDLGRGADSFKGRGL